MGRYFNPDLTARSLGGFAQLQHKLNERSGAGGSFTWMKVREQPEGRDWQEMTGYRIPPLKLTAYLEFKSSEAWSNRVQATYFDALIIAWMALPALDDARSTATPPSI